MPWRLPAGLVERLGAWRQGGHSDPTGLTCPPGSPCGSGNPPPPPGGGGGGNGSGSGGTPPPPPSGGGNQTGPGNGPSAAQIKAYDAKLRWIAQMAAAMRNQPCTGILSNRGACPIEVTSVQLGLLQSGITWQQIAIQAGMMLIPGIGEAGDLADAADTAAIAARTAKTAATATEDAGAASRGVSFIAKSNGEVIRVPEGASGPIPAESGKGFQFTGGSGGAPLDSRVAGVRVMERGYSGKYLRVIQASV